MSRSNGGPGASGARGLEHLDVEECWRLLGEATLGRLALTDASGRPDVFPINIVAHEGAIYARSAEGSKLDAIAGSPEAALEVDGQDEEYRWSVVVRGEAARLETDMDAATDAEIEASGVLHLASANPSGKPYVIRLRASTVSGRRVRIDRGGTPAGAPPTTGPVIHAKRAQPPRPIPHRPPPQA